MENKKTEQEIFEEAMQEIIDGRRIIHKITVESNLLESTRTGYLEEGLIKTYPIRTVVKMMSECFDLVLTTEKGGVDETLPGFKHNGTINIAGDEETGEVIIISVRKSDYNRKKMDTCLNKYGYFCAGKRDKGVWELLQYEKKFDTDVTSTVESLGYVYHICPANLEKKIFEQGLTPHDSKWPEYSNGPRLYFFYGEVDFTGWAKDFKLNKKQDTKEYLLLKINLNKLAHRIIFYLDPRMKNGVYTLEGIPPQAIEIVKRIPV